VIRNIVLYLSLPPRSRPEVKEQTKFGYRKVKGRGPYSPDLNPIEEAFSKLKHILRKICARGKEALTEAMGRALGAVSVQDVRGFFTHCGYRTPAQQL
jgi:hypothetical protein